MDANARQPTPVYMHWLLPELKVGLHTCIRRKAPAKLSHLTCTIQRGHFRAHLACAVCSLPTFTNRLACCSMLLNAGFHCQQHDTSVAVHVNSQTHTKRHSVHMTHVDDRPDELLAVQVCINIG